MDSTQPSAGTSTLVYDPAAWTNAVEFVPGKSWNSTSKFGCDRGSVVKSERGSFGKKKKK